MAEFYQLLKGIIITILHILFQSIENKNEIREHFQLTITIYVTVHKLYTKTTKEL